MSILERSQAQIPNEKVEAAAQAQTGVYPLLWWLPYGEFLTMFNARRVVAVTDQSVTVLKAGRMRWNHSRPTRVLYSVPRATPIGPFAKRWAHVQIGDERLWLHKRAYRFLEQALGQQSTAPTPAATAGGIG